MDTNDLHRRQPLRNMMRVGIGLENILALDVERAECAVDCGIEHVGDAQPRLRIDRDAPVRLEQRASCPIRNVAIARKLVREAAYVAGTLDIVDRKSTRLNSSH